MDEFGMRRPTEAFVLSVGSSSGGSAAAVAAI